MAQQSSDGEVSMFTCMKSLPPVQFTALHLRSLPDERKLAFYGWIRSMTPALDNEQGMGPGSFEEWLCLHEENPTDTTYVFFDQAKDTMLGTASLVKQDREHRAAHEGWIIGGVNVVRELRQKGIGSAIMHFLDDELYQRANALKHDIPVKLFAGYEHAITIYLRVGFVKDVSNQYEYAKIYKPTLLCV